MSAALPEEEGAVAVTRVELRRMGAADLVRRDEELSRSEFARSVSEQSLERILQSATGKRFSREVPIFREGDSCSAMYLVLRGEVRFLGRAASDQADFGGAGRGELFGEDVVGPGGRRYSAVSLGAEVDVLELSSETVRQVLGVEPGLRRLLEGLRERRESARQEMCDFLGRW